VPTYPYACTACGHAFEVQQSFSDPSLTECPECSGRLRKVFSSVGVVFKGSGFYRTDSRKGSSGAGSKDTSNGTSSGAGSSDGGSTSGNGSTASKNPDSSSGSSTGSSSSSAKPAASSAKSAASSAPAAGS
jgi:putative FmdB family regulatory protein